MSDTRFKPIDWGQDFFDPKERSETAREPAKRWRNLWLATTDTYAINADTGQATPRSKGEEFWGSRIFPTREVAETFARKAQHMDTSRGVEPLVWLGAFPVESETP